MQVFRLIQTHTAQLFKINDRIDDINKKSQTGPETYYTRLTLKEQAAVCKHRSQFTDNLLIQLWHTAFSHAVFLCAEAADTLLLSPKDVVLLPFFVHVSRYQILTDRDGNQNYD